MSTSLAAPRAVPWAELAEFLQEELVNCLRSNSEFSSATSFREQCYHACTILRLNHHPAVPYSLIGRIFGVSKPTIRGHYQSYLAHARTSGSNGRPPLLSEDVREALFHHIEDSFLNRRPLTLSQIRDYLELTHHVSVDKTAVFHILRRDPHIKSCPGIPMEQTRVDVTPAQIAEFFASLITTIDGIPAHFVLNTDEMGHQDWADRQRQTCYVPATVPDDHVYVPVSRAGKRITLIACIAADGSYLKPTVIIPRKTVDSDLPTTGLTDEKVEIGKQPKGYIVTEIFEKWLGGTFIPELLRRRAMFGYAGPAVLLLDGCTAHSSAKISALCEANRVIAFPFPPHSSNQLQPLDLSVFGVTKRLLARVNRMESMNVQSDHIAKVVCAFMAAATPVNIVKTFRRAGICVVLDDDVLRCRVCPDRAQCLIAPISAALPEVPDDDEDDMEADLYVEQCASLLFDGDDTSD